MEIYFERTNTNKTIEIKKQTTIKSILKKFNIINESVILVKNNKICLEDTTITNKDKLKILSVVSGG